MIVLLPLHLDTLSATAPLLANLAASVPAALYVGPDQLMPLTSIAGAILGVVLLLWNWLVGAARRCYAVVFRRPRREGTATD